MNREDVIRIVEAARERGERPDLRGADLSEASLREVDLQYANLCKADLTRADLSGSKYGILDLLRAYWNPDDHVVIELMRWDAWLHPHPERFEEWAKGGDCPCYVYARAFHFREMRDLFQPGPPQMSPVELLTILCRQHNIKVSW